MTPQEQAAAVRRGVGLFALADRGLVVVRGGDRVRWLDGMISGDVASLADGPERSGCYAALLTRQGRVVAELHVLLRGEELWLELERDVAARVVEHLEGFIIADDVALEDRSDAVARLGIEGPRAPELVAALLGEPPSLAADACGEAPIDGRSAVIAAFGWSGAPAYQLLAPGETGAGLAEAVRRAGAGLGLVEAGPEALEILRIEAGLPRQGPELGEDVLPAEARLERAISTTKGCYTGQEVVARMASRGRVSHLLVGLTFQADAPPSAGAEVRAGEERVGELTSVCVSPAAGPIGLAYVRSARARVGTEVSVAGVSARVADLPFAGVA